MKLLIDGEIYSWHRGGGITKVFNEIIPRLRRRGLNVQVALKKHSGSCQINSDILPCIQWIPQLPPRLWPWRLWKRLGPLVNSWLEWSYWRKINGDVFLSTYYTNPAVRALKVALVYDMIFELYPECFEAEFCKQTVARQRAAVKSADMIVCISENTKRDVVRLYGIQDSKCCTIHIGGAASGCQRAEYPDTALAPFLLYVGDYRCPYKNFEFILAALRGTDNPEITKLPLVVASRFVPSESECRHFAGLLGSAHLRFVSNSSDADLMSLYRDCSALIYPSRYEGFGLPVQEALSQGTPVVCSNAASLPEVGGDAVYYFDPLLPAEFGVALVKALSEGRNKEAVAKRKVQASRFSWEKTADEFAELFQTIVAAHSGNKNAQQGCC